MTVRWTVRAAELTEQGYARGETEALLPAPQVRFISKTKALAFASAFVLCARLLKDVAHNVSIFFGFTYERSIDR